MSLSVLPERRSGGKLVLLRSQRGNVADGGVTGRLVLPRAAGFFYPTQTGQTGLSNWVKALASVLSGQNHKINKPQTSNKSNVSG